MPAPEPTLRDLLEAVEALRRELAEVRDHLGLVRQRGLPLPPSAGPCEDLVTLDQAAAIVRRQKRSLERYLKDMPRPRISGRRGQPSLWLWSELRPWLEEAFGFRLPDRYPGH